MKVNIEIVEGIIKDAATASGIGSGATAQIAITGADLALTLSILIPTVGRIASLFGVEYSDGEIRKFLTTYVLSSIATYYGLKAVTGFIPVLGNIFNGLLTSQVVHGIGWATYYALYEGYDLREMTRHDWTSFMSRAKKRRSH